MSYWVFLGYLGRVVTQSATQNAIARVKESCSTGSNYYVTYTDTNTGSHIGIPEHFFSWRKTRRPATERGAGSPISSHLSVRNRLVIIPAMNWFTMAFLLKNPYMQLGGFCNHNGERMVGCRAHNFPNFSTL